MTRRRSMKTTRFPSEIRAASTALGDPIEFRWLRTAAPAERAQGIPLSTWPIVIFSRPMGGKFNHWQIRLARAVHAHIGPPGLSNPADLCRDYVLPRKGILFHRHGRQCVHRAHCSGIRNVSRGRWKQDGTSRLQGADVFLDCGAGIFCEWQCATRHRRCRCVPIRGARLRGG